MNEIIIKNANLDKFITTKMMTFYLGDTDTLNSVFSFLKSQNGTVKPPRLSLGSLKFEEAAVLDIVGRVIEEEL
jgi:hypothetical protein